MSVAINKIFHLPKEINHKVLFLFGFLFYFVAPVIILQTDFLDGLPGIDGWKEANVLDNFHFNLYISLISWFFVSFYIGSYFGEKYINVKYAVKRDFGDTSAKMIMCFVGIFTFIFIIKMRGLAFHGYSEDVNGNPNTGIMSTINMLLFYIHFVVEQPKKNKANISDYFSYK